MNQKELNELRRRFQPDRGNFTELYGCYVNGGTREIITELNASLSLLPQEEGEMYLTLLKKTLSGALNRNLLDIAFSNAQVMGSAEHELLMALREKSLREEQTRRQLYQNIIAAFDSQDENYLILLGADRYDVPYRGTDDLEQEDASENVFRYVVCAICPVKEATLSLRYSAEEKTFRAIGSGQVASPPAAGFLFPAFNGRAADLYHAVYYAKDPAAIHPELIEALFHTQPRLSPAEQGEAFREAVSTGLEENCSFDVLQSVHEQLRERIVAHKESHDPEPLEMTLPEVADLLRVGGAEEAQVRAFSRECEKSFGEDAMLAPLNLIDSGKFRVETPYVKITVDPDQSYLLQLREIEGRSYLLIPAEEGVEVNGVSLQRTKREE